MLAQFGIKKPAVQRALDALAEEGKITCKVRFFVFLFRFAFLSLSRL